jgi:long-chain acyl-CoA synthetase
MSLVGPLLAHARTTPDALALIEGDRTIDYRELAILVRRTAAHLARLGTQRGDRIGICLRDTAVHVVAFLAIVYLGAVAVPLDWRARPAENRRTTQGLGVRLILAEPGGQLEADAPVVAVDETWDRKVAVADPREAPAAEWQDPFLIAASSGSSGAPKLTLLTHLQFFFRLVASLEVMGLSGRHRYLGTLPLYYSGGRTRCLAHLMRGDCVVLYPSLFRPSEYIEEVDRHGITACYVVPSMVRQLLSVADAKPVLPNLALLFCSGAPLHADEKRDAARRLTPRFHEEYGAAEIGCLTVLRPSDLAQRAESVGQPHSLVEIEVTDDQGRALAAGDAGNIRFRGPALGVPIAADASVTTGAELRERWHTPGEIGRIDELGYLFIHGRTSDVIMRGGAKIYPVEVEAVLQEHPEVVEAAVIGSRATSNDEEVMAFVATRGPVRAGELVAHCRARLSPHKVPRIIRVLPRLPKTTSGKIDKTALTTISADEV